MFNEEYIAFTAACEFLCKAKLYKATEMNFFYNLKKEIGSHDRRAFIEVMLPDIRQTAQILFNEMDVVYTLYYESQCEDNPEPKYYGAQILDMIEKAVNILLRSHLNNSAQETQEYLYNHFLKYYEDWQPASEQPTDSTSAGQQQIEVSYANAEQRHADLMGINVASFQKKSKCESMPTTDDCVDYIDHYDECILHNECAERSLPELEEYLKRNIA